LKRIYNAVVGHSLIRNAHAHIAVTSSEVHQFGDYGVELSKIAVIPNGVDAESFAAIDSKLFRERHALANAPLILFMGRLNSIKGPDLLLDAFAQVAEQFSSYLLVFAGPDEGMEASLRETALRHGISNRVRFLGYVGGEEKTAAYRAATLLVIPSRMEAMSIVALECGAAGVPVLITDQCGFDMVEEIGGGRVVKAEATAIAEGLESMLSDAVNLANTGQRLCNLVRRDFTWNAAALRLSAIFEAVLVQRRG
jgi:glycosyltransferase involved in cell wall biosynthesis